MDLDEIAMANAEAEVLIGERITGKKVKNCYELGNCNLEWLLRKITEGAQEQGRGGLYALKLETNRIELFDKGYSGRDGDRLHGYGILIGALINGELISSFNNDSEILVEFDVSKERHRKDSKDLDFQRLAEYIKKSNIRE